MKILIPVDGSDASYATLNWAADMLNTTNVTFDLLAVIADTMVAEYKVEDAVEILEKSRRVLEGKGFRVEKAQYITGDPVERICQYAYDEDVDQILVGSHGRSGIARALLGSVSEGLLKHSKKPVFIFRATQDQLAGSPL